MSRCTLHTRIATQSQRRQFSHQLHFPHSPATEAETADEHHSGKKQALRHTSRRVAAQHAQLPCQKLPSERVLYFLLEEWGKQDETGRTRTPQAHTAVGEKPLESATTFTCLRQDSGLRKAAGGDELRFQQLRQCLSTPFTQTRSRAAPNRKILPTISAMIFCY